MVVELTATTSTSCGGAVGTRKTNKQKEQLFIFSPGFVSFSVVAVGKMFQDYLQKSYALLISACGFI